jgi:hypothetical protein
MNNNSPYRLYKSQLTSPETISGGLQNEIFPNLLSLFRFASAVSTQPRRFRKNVSWMGEEMDWPAREGFRV